MTHERRAGTTASEKHAGAGGKALDALRELKPLGHHFRRQVPLGRYYADFCCHRARLIVEIDGETHLGDEAEARDALRNTFILGEGYRVLRFTNVEVMRNLDGVMTVIVSALGDPHPHSLPPRGREA